MSKKKHPQGYWMAVGISARLITDGQTITVEAAQGNRIVELSNKLIVGLELTAT